jgi:N-acetylmuramoyl-L-alanine amidase
MTLSGVASQVSAKEQPLKTSNGHSKPAAKKAGAKRIVMLDPGHGGIDTGAIGHNGSKRSMSYWRLPKTCAAFCAATALTPA